MPPRSPGPLPGPSLVLGLGAGRRFRLSPVGFLVRWVVKPQAEEGVAQASARLEHSKTRRLERSPRIPGARVGDPTRFMEPSQLDTGVDGTLQVIGEEGASGLNSLLWIPDSWAVPREVPPAERSPAPSEPCPRGAPPTGRSLCRPRPPEPQSAWKGPCPGQEKLCPLQAEAPSTMKPHS